MAEKREEIQKLFSKELRENEKLRRLQKKVESGKATYREAEKFAAEVGKAYANSFQSVVGNAEKIGGDQYFEVAKEVFPPGLHSIYSETAAYVEQVQRLQNEEAGIGLKPLVPDYSDVHSDYLRKLQGTVTESAMDHVIASESEFYAQQVVDRALEMNAEAQQNAGLEVSVTRIYDGVGVHNRKDPCEWCLSRCGENMTLQEAKSKDAFRRHPGCGCTIIYKSAKGETTVRVGGGGWINAEEYAKIETRKKAGLNEEPRWRPEEQIKRTVVGESLANGSVLDALNENSQQIHSEKYRDQLSERSYLFGGIEEAKRLFDKLKGTGSPVLDKNGNWTHKERVVNDSPIGKIKIDGEWVETRRIMIIYSKIGSHLYPRR